MFEHSPRARADRACHQVGRVRAGLATLSISTPGVSFAPSPTTSSAVEADRRVQEVEVAGGVLVGAALRLVDARAQSGGARAESGALAETGPRVDAGGAVELRVLVHGRVGGGEEGGARHVVGGLREADEERCTLLSPVPVPTADYEGVS